MTRLARALPAAALALLGARAAFADSYRLRADAFASAQSPVGLLVLQAEERRPSLLNAEALVWTGAGDRPGDVLVVTVGVRDPLGRGEARVGRMIASTGAIRPVHLDGALLRAGGPTGPRVEVFGGLPVEPGFVARGFDWVVGQRVSTRSEDSVTVGLSYLHQRDEGRVAFEEIGVDGWVAPLPWFDAAVIAALDTVRGGASDARAQIA